MDGLPFSEAMRLQAGTGSAGDGAATPAVVEWGETVAGPWLTEIIAGLAGRQTGSSASIPDRRPGPLSGPISGWACSGSICCQAQPSACLPTTWV